MKRIISSVLLFAAIALLVAGCAKEGKPALFSSEAKIISHKTAGFISPDGEIGVRFVDDRAEASQVGLSLKKEVFKFDPSIEGVTSWADRRTLILKPAKQLPVETKFEGYLDLTALFPGEEHKLERIEIEFETGGLEISSIKADFELLDESNPTDFVFAGRLNFNLTTTPEDVLKSVELWEGKRKVELEITPDSEGGYSFRSEKITRTDQDKRFVLEVSAKRLKLSSDFKNEYILPSKVNFVVTGMEIVEFGSEVGVEIDLSDELARGEDIRGFIRVEPALEFRATAKGKTIALRGDFTRGTSYEIVVLAGLRSRWGTRVSENFSQTVEFPSILPQVNFASNGIFLPSSNKKSIDFNTVNVRRVFVTVQKVYENNLAFFMQENYFSDRSRRNWGYADLYRVGEVVATDTLEIGDVRDKWLKSRLDLSKLVKEPDRGAFVVELSFEENDILTSLPEDWPWWRKNSYFWESGRTGAAIIFTDLGLIVKNSGDKIGVFAVDLISTEPIAGASITLKSYVNQVIALKTTDSRGYCEFDTAQAFAVEGEYRGNRTVLITRDMELNTSVFDVGGSTSPAEDTRAYIFTERGVHRPGDTIHLSALLRNADGSFPKNHPVTLVLFDPLGKKVLERISREAEDGFYYFAVSTEETAPTGFWRAELSFGDRSFSHPLRIETVVPYRIKTKLECDPKRLTRTDPLLRAELQANYLFGNPAGGLDADVSLSIRPFEVSFDRFSDFYFSNEALEFSPINLHSQRVKLDSDGKSQIKWDIPEVHSVPSALIAEVSAEVFEKGGRAVPVSQKVPFEYYNRYVGIDAPDFVRVGSVANFSVILLDREGRTIGGNTLEYRIYKSQRYWWFDFENEVDFRKHFKSDIATELTAEGTVVSGSLPAIIEWKPDSYGAVFVEVTDRTGGHVAGVFVNARHWGYEPSGGDADLLVIKADKEKYRPGDVATVIVQTPESGRALLSVEAGKKLVYSKWQKLDSEETVFEVPITRDMVPTAYAFVTAIQPHANTANDLPMRLYGIVPLPVELEESRIELEIEAPEKLEPGKKFTVEIASKDKSPFQYTIAVVDEGLLDLTHFQTPDPWGFFYRRMALIVRTFDIYSYVIGANWGDIHKKFSVGGGLAEYELQRSPVKALRFKPVALFSGVGKSSSKGQAKVEFTMPEYVGSVRIMVVAAKGPRFGSSELAVPVKAPLMVLPTLPRVLAPGDEVALPVSVFAMENGVGQAAVEVSVEGPVKVIGQNKLSLDLPDIAERDIVFRLKAENAIGVAKIKISAKSGGYSISDETEIAVRPSNPWTHASTTKPLSAGESAKFTIPADGIAGTNNARFTVNRVADINQGGRLNWLISYPYGCIEQTVSAAFPQLYLPEVSNLSERRKGQIDKNINAAIDGLRKFQLYSGGFGYWPNASESNDWVSTYAGHFMLEAKARGYFVPQDMLDNWLKFERDRSRGDPENLMIQAYRLYVLAKAGSPQSGAMNLMRQNYLSKMDNPSRWLLASAYLATGADKTAREIVASTGTDVREYREMSWTFGSSLRDKAIVLDGLVQFGREGEAFLMFNDIAKELASDRWLSTQETAFALRSASIFLREYLKKAGPLEGKIILPDGKKIPIDNTKSSFTVEIENGFGKELSVEVTSGKGFGTLSWFGIPALDTLGTMSKNLSLSIHWLDEDGTPIEPSRLTQNRIFWEHIRVANPSGIELSELALTQVLPSGWEIENIRLSGENYPDWAKDYRLSTEEYLDIRDDRAMWFFDLRGNSQADFLLKLNTVTVGSFRLPPTQVEVMYDDRYQARVAGRDVEVLK